MSALAERFAAHLAALELEPRPVILAVSGGPDSLALLHLMHEAPPAGPPALTVCHVDHGIHPASADVAESVRVATAALGLPFESTALHLGPRATETRARAARYKWLRDVARSKDAWLFTAHHRDDQVETVLMRVLKGSGPAGLAGMAGVSGRLVRPLLPFGREEIHEYLEGRGIPAWDDPANADPRHLRSWLRSRVLPALRTRLPRVEANLLRVGELAALDRSGWDAVVDLLELDHREEAPAFSFSAGPLRGKPAGLVQAVFLAIARRYGFTFGVNSARRVRGMIERGHSGSRVNLGGVWEAGVDFGRVRVRDTPVLSPQAREAAKVPGEVEIAGASGSLSWGVWRLEWTTTFAPRELERVSWTTWLELGRYAVRPWRAGDRIRPYGGTGQRLVVRCMQEARIPREDRGVWPVVTQGRGIVWVPGVCRSSGPIESEVALKVTFLPA